MKRTMAIGDIHGCYNLLEDLMEEIKFNPKDDTLIFLGDYIDRGEDSALVMEYVLQLKEKYPENIILLIGNHEEMAKDFLTKMEETWTYNGYNQTLESYSDKYGTQYLERFYDDIKKLYEVGQYYYETDKNIFVHAGVKAGVPMEEQDLNTILWAREEYLYSEDKYSKLVVSGHTPSIHAVGTKEAYRTVAGNIVIDTGAVFTGCLTAYILEDNETIKFIKVEDN